MSHREAQPLLEAIDARERALCREAEQTRARIGELTTTLGEGDEASTHLQITRTTLPTLVSEDGAEPAARPTALPNHPAYRQTMDAFADLGRPLRARDLCQALDPPIVYKNVENTRSKLKRLVSLGILVETEPSLFTQSRP